MGKGGGGGGQPQTTTAYQTNLPEYAKPYVENMLNAAQKQVYNDDMTSFRPYTPYSSDPSQYFAGPSNLQRSTYGEAAGMQTPGQYGMATGLGGLAAMGQMGAGRQFTQQATDPRAIQAYMSPFMQNVVDTQKLSAVRDYQIAQPARQAQAVRAGAFGGSRQAIENAEAQRNLMSQLQSIQATGTQKAFEDAQRQQQFGANLNLQGLQGLSSTAGMLGQLGGAQQQADLARMGFQNQLGQQQQQFQQNIINQAVQDYATQQQYPMLQLANMSNLLRGLPMQSATTQTYQAAPNALSQLGGLGATALGVYGASGGFRAAEGGQVKSYAGGGVVGGIESQLMQMEIPQLQQVAKTSPSASIREKAAEIIAQKQMAMQTKQAMGIDSLPAGNLDDIGMAGGGIVAFENGGDVDEEKRREYEKYGEPGSLKRKFKSIIDYYQSPSSAEGVKRNILNSSMALGPVSGMPVAMGAGNISRGINYASDVPGVINQLRGVSNAVSGTGPLPVPGNVVADAAPAATTTAPSPTSAAPASTTSGATRDAGGKYEKEIEAGLAELKKGLGGSRAQQDLDALREEMRGNKDQNLWLSLIQGGAKAMQSTSPHALVGLGAGVEEGAKTYGKGLEGERADKKLLLAQQSALEQVEYARKSGNLNALIQAQARLDAIKAQRENLGASKELAILSAREKGRGDMIQKLMYQNGMDEETATAIANRAYPSTIGTATAASEAMPKGVVVRKKSS
jgi:hypothetical protein